MPLPKRSIEPVHVARSVYQQDELQSVELETVTNTTLTNIIRQLSSLSKHAEDVFGELARDVGSIGERANSLQARIDRLAIKVTQLDSTVEEVPLTDITRKKAFKSAKVFDQQIFSRATMPAPMLETYTQCDKPPPLDKLNIYRDDGKDGLKFYTDPNYFFELWRQEMLKDTERVMHDKGKKMHRPRPDGGSSNVGGRGHKKRVRTPHNTREKQRQIAIGHGETLMPNNVIYRTPNSMTNEEAGYCSMGVYDTRPPRPNSIELRRSYQPEQVDGTNYGYGSGTPQATAGQYATAYGTNGVAGGQQMHQQPHQGGGLQHHQQIYEDTFYHQSQALYGHTGQGPMSPEPIYVPGTPGRTKPRPSQPPPAPPSNGSGGGTPNASNGNTPTRGRSMSTSRDALPPPPPVPDAIPMNGAPSGHITAKLLGRANSTSRAGSPQMAPSNSTQDANALVMAQLNSTINSFNHIIVSGNQLNSISDLPPPPPVSEQHSPKISPPSAAPPPPPPPPPLDENNSGSQLQNSHHMRSKVLANSNELQLNQLNGGIVVGPNTQHILAPKKLLPPFQDPRNDLMKAIRDGITLRKVEKSEQKEIDRNTALLDVASILARRVAIELSESEDSDSEDDSEGWMEPNEAST
ncbi:wiskott-Aldrich syndrome protein family member 3 isoform X2 [Scaptodrosophila lebanonensis]|uniref:Wiskott-Aldrich syndrome protein family member n=1 Tax=Drosophila lebanonensis TaxID=7225 RepID=A0A6J2U917_DROLE|nr:wiskott-Aldrich syndrome protein family member 3 isoform X2 [Scaptodrosophila lebanonensis]